MDFSANGLCFGDRVLWVLFSDSVGGLRMLRVCGFEYGLAAAAASAATAASTAADAVMMSCSSRAAKSTSTPS